MFGICYLTLQRSCLFSLRWRTYFSNSRSKIKVLDFILKVVSFCLVSIFANFFGLPFDKSENVFSSRVHNIATRLEEGSCDSLLMFFFFGWQGQRILVDSLHLPSSFIFIFCCTLFLGKERMWFEQSRKYQCVICNALPSWVLATLT